MKVYKLYFSIEEVDTDDDSVTEVVSENEWLGTFSSAEDAQAVVEGLGGVMGDIEEQIGVEEVDED